MTSPPLDLNDIFAGYGNEIVLAGATLKLESGTITGLLGRNGSGKTTMMRVALGLMKSTDGHARLFGSPAWNAPPEVRKRIGFVPQNFHPFAPMTVEGCLNLVGEQYETWDQDFVDALRREWRVGNRRIAKLSPGDQQKVSILLGIGHRPDLLILDEPAASLDPGARREFLRALVDLNTGRGQTVLLSSHITSDIERICSHIAVLHNGRILCHAALDEIKDRVRRVTINGSAQPPVENMLAKTGNHYWLWDWNACGLPADTVADKIILEDLFLAMTS